MCRFFAWLTLCASFCLSIWAQPFPGSLLNGLEWRLIGPFRGGRVLAVTGVPGDPYTFYFGAVDGGVWKTQNGGVTWSPIFDQQHIASIGAIAVAPSNSNIIYTGTGEADMRSDIAVGDGVYKSTDAGQTWTNTGLRDSRQIGRILIDPAEPDLVYVAALGHAYGPNEQRGVYRSKDGGRSWQKILDKGPDIGAGDLAMDPANPRVIYAAMWAARRTPWSKYPPSGIPGSGLYKSTDGGDHWTELRDGLPKGDWGRVGIAAARGFIYALIDAPGDAQQGGLFRSADAGGSWERVGKDPRLITRAWYFSSVTVDPNNPQAIYLPNVAVYRSLDGGKTFDVLKGGPGGDDYHSLWIDPKNSSRMILGTDQGATISVDGGKTWSSWYNQPTAQLYHVTTDNQFPYHVYGSQQDSGSIMVASRTDHFQITERDQFNVGGGESGYIAVDPKDPNIVFAGDTYGMLIRYDRRTSQGQTVTPWLAGTGNDIDQQKFRFPWTPPLLFSPTDLVTLYYGSQYLLATSDGGLNWRQLSPDLTGASEAKSTGPVTLENAKSRGFGVIYSIAPSPFQSGVIWIGSDTGLIQLTRDGGKSWSNVTPQGLPAWSKITSIEASRFDAAVAYAAVDGHRIEDYKPHLYRTRDFGKSWTEIVNGLSSEPAYLNAIREDPVRKGLLFAATEMGVSVSFDDGDHWQPLQANLPVTSVRDLVIHGDDLVIATHGRSFWILDDITPLRHIDTKLGATALLPPATAIRMSGLDFQGTPLPPETPTAKNPPDGAILDFYFAAAPRGEVTLEIFDARNQLVRRFSTADPAPPPLPPLAIAPNWLTPPPRFHPQAGMNRFVWDLRYAVPVEEVSADSDSGHPQTGPQVVPGMYRVQLTADGRSYTQTLQVVLDPRSTATPADLNEQLELALKASEAMKRAAEAVRASKDPQVATDLRAIEAQLSAVLAIVESSDRRPPSQAYAIFEEAIQKLAH